MPQERRLTVHEEEIIQFMRAFLAERQRLPTHRQICARFGWKWDNSCRFRLNRIEQKGHILRDSNNKIQLKYLHATPESLQNQPPPRPTGRPRGSRTRKGRSQAALGPF